LSLREKLIRNTDEVRLECQHRPPLNGTACGGIADGLAAKKLGADAPGTA
jgi:hypothetical protein